MFGLVIAPWIVPLWQAFAGGVFGFGAATGLVVILTVVGGLAHDVARATRRRPS